MKPASKIELAPSRKGRKGRKDKKAIPSIIHHPRFHPVVLAIALLVVRMRIGFRFHSLTTPTAFPMSPLLNPAKLSRADLLNYLYEHASKARCVSLVGVNNVGKSWLLRDFRRPEMQMALRPDLANALHIFYVDCNRMLEVSEQAFYELILRVMLQHLRQDETALRDRIVAAYDQLISPPSKLHIPLSFNQAITALVESRSSQAVFVFDEFDSAFRALDGRAFLNLRALKDRYGDALSYVTATHRRLIHLRMGEDVDDFIELFGANVRYVPPMGEADAREVIDACAREMQARFDDADMAFLLNQSGGHPVLLEMACRKLAQITGLRQRTASEDQLIHREVRDLLRRDPGVIAECQKIWRDLTDQEQTALEGLFSPDRNPQPEAMDELRRKGVLVANGDEPQVFAALFEDFLMRRLEEGRTPRQGVRVDVESGVVTVDGRPVENLTRLEFRLLLLLYGRMNKICDKYSIVESVWGEEYVDEVYDSAIEKLVSRLRRKIEPDPSHPRYIVTVRGRGYKLVG